MKGSRDTTPFILTTGATPISIAVTGGVPQAAASILPALDLTNTLRVPVEVREICFAVDEPGVAANQGQLIGGLEVDLRVGRFNITQGFAPVTALAVRRESAAVEASGAAPFYSPDQIRWVLPRPLYLAPNEPINGFIRLNSSLTYPAVTSTVRVVMTARSRRLPAGMPVPNPRKVPYASGFFYIKANSPPAQDSIFRNIFSVPLHVTSINARPVPDVVNPPVIGGKWKVDMLSSNSRSIALNPYGSNLFAQRLALEVPFDLEAKDSLMIQTDTITGIGVAVALTGWREET